MAQMLHATRFKSPATSVASFNVTIPATAAGSKLVCVAGGGAIIQAKLGVGGTNFTRRTNSLNNREVVAQDIVDSGGGTTTIQITLNGPENVDGMIYEFAAGALGNYIGGAIEAISGITSDGGVATGTVTTSGAAVLFAMFTLNESVTSPPATNQMFGFEPLGKQYANEFIGTDPTKSLYWTLIGVSDLASAGTYAAKTSGINAGTGQQSCVWAYENLDTGTPTYTNPYANAIAEENSLPGQLQPSWFGPGMASTVAGYTDNMSYAPGDTVNFKVDSFNTAFTVEIYRCGFYGYALFGAKLHATVTGTPASQPSPTVNSYGGTVCGWATTATWAIPADAVPGVYFYNMNRSGTRAQGIFVVRSTPPGSRANAIMLTTADFTWQAYNFWGATTDTGTSTTGYTGRSLYQAAQVGGIGSRAFAVSYDRPMGTVSSNGTTYFWDSEFALLNFLEGNGYNMAYYAMADLEKDPTIPSKYTVAVSSGHSEYWSDNLRNAYENARDAGTHLFLNTSNTSLWRVRFDPTDSNCRNIICYKDSHDTAGYDGTTKYDPVSYTGTWRDSRMNAGGVNNTVRRPESGMTGQWFIGNGTFEDRLAIPATYASLPIWRNTAAASTPTITVRGTGTANATTPGNGISVSQPSGTQVGDLLVVAVTCTGQANFNYSAPFRLVRLVTSTGPGQQTMALLAGYALVSGSATHDFAWSSATLNASAVLVCYGGAVWEDLDSSLHSDRGGTAAHTTLSIGNNGATRWAVCAFGDNDTTGSQKTTTWTAGSGLTSRAQSDNSSSGSGPWCSTAIMDTGAAVTQGVHQYTATAQFANPQAFAGIFYISPGTPGAARTIGAEWDYVKAEEPSTPANLVRLSSQVLPVRGGAANYNGNSYGDSGLFRYGLTLYQATSGALVFNTGSWRFSCGLSRFRFGLFDNSATGVNALMQQATLNILRDMGVSPTTVLTTTANLNATPLVDPGSAAAPSAYGFPVAASTPVYQNIFGVTAPALTNENDNADYNLGTVFTAAVGGKIYGMRWHFPGILPDAPVVATLYQWTGESTGTQLATATFRNAQTGWNTVLLGSPVTITAGAKYVAAVYTDSYYVTTAGMFASGSITRADLTAIQDTSAGHNGKFLASAGAPAYPSSTFGSNGYLVDVLFIGEGFEGWGLPLA